MVEFNAFRLFIFATLGCVLYLYNRSPGEGKLTERVRRAPVAGTAAAVWSGLPYTCNAQGQMSLTFDDGPGTNTRDLLAQLDASKVLATFHVTTSWLSNSLLSPIVKEIYTAGHIVGIRFDPAGDNGNDPHEALKMTPAQVVAYFQNSANIIYKLINVYPKFVRMPYQGVTSEVRAGVEAAGFVISAWAIDSNDYAYANQNVSTTKLGDDIVARYKRTLYSTPADNQPIVLFSGNLALTGQTMSTNIKVIQAALTTPLVQLDVCLGVTEKYRTTNTVAATAAVPAGGASGGAAAGGAAAGGAAGTPATTAAAPATTTEGGAGSQGQLSGALSSSRASLTLMLIGVVAAVFVSVM